MNKNNVCGIGQRCHVNGKGITRFGTQFPQQMVRKLATSSVLLVEVDPGNPIKQVASGTLIAENVVLCASHTLGSMLLKKTEVHLFYECTDGSAGAAPYKPEKGEQWRTCNLAADAPQAKVVKEIESGMKDDLDYSLIVIEWKNTLNLYGQDMVIDLPRPPVIPKPSPQLSAELISLGHYMYDVTTPKCEPTQATVGKLLKEHGPYYFTLKGTEYNYASFAPELSGFSGGGIFNKYGDIVGVYSGRLSDVNAKMLSLEGSTSFLDLGQCAKKLPESRLADWFNNPSKPPSQTLLRKGDSNQSAAFRQYTIGES
ncbi:hypothetical protein [Paenibacillus sp. P46E]|uniref:hypothetical protein n=1 Tax=Paenibacillus sp. P46E TaxID=1349436 RepID=UPI0009401E67|nr:hypothetical protein [Paenibacillus sp. P46E]OKP95482.1 hypothetical protein A3849_25645 [Paenibacillus sp. P46E]